jgi:hypothetical protein
MNHLKPEQQVTIWVLNCALFDEDKTYFATKMEAEKAARYLFPDMDVDQRYARISYIKTQPYSPC